ncbi:MAG: lysophospholipid acyltransferase family protein [Fuerstiella sp.]|nr:lysophospholipid acyltransferase family protein [Fuerstiella sp.]
MTSESQQTGLTDKGVLPSQGLPRRTILWLLIHAFLYPLFRLWCRTVVIGRENIDNTQGGIFIVNHQSFLDPLFVGVRLTRPVAYMARDSLFKLPFIGWVCRWTHVIPISRTAFRGSSIRTAIDRLTQGFLVGIYPEGTRSSGAPKEFRPGFLSLVRRAEVPVYPVAVVGADRAMPRNAWFIRPGRVTVVFGKPLTDEQRQRLLENDVRASAAEIRDMVAKLYEQGLND